MEINRRSALKAAAWTAPVVVITAAAPAYANSEPECMRPMAYAVCKSKNCWVFYVKPACRVAIGGVFIDNKQATKISSGRWRGWYGVTRSKFTQALPVVIVDNKGKTVFNESMPFTKY